MYNYLTNNRTEWTCLFFSKAFCFDDRSFKDEFTTVRNSIKHCAQRVLSRLESVYFDFYIAWFPVILSITTKSQTRRHSLQLVSGKKIYTVSLLLSSPSLVRSLRAWRGRSWDLHRPNPLGLAASPSYMVSFPPISRKYCLLRAGVISLLNRCVSFFQSINRWLLEGYN